jgi:regulation of enolase protein 1 (concanavalin A-like superfamily)
LPVHLKLVQAGKDIRVFTSADGQNWGKPRMSHTAAFDAKSRIGLFVCSGNTFSSTTAVFDFVAVRK